MAERGLRQNSMAFVACICACRSLNEITSLLDVICNINRVDSAYTPVHIRMMVETLAQEISRRKRTDISLWTTTRSENALDAVVVPLLVRLLSFKTDLPVVVQATFGTGLPDELTIQSGEILHVLHEYTDGWVLCQNDKGEQGMVPSKCLGKIPASELNTSIAVALAIFTQAVPDMEFLKYSTESQRVHDFYYLLCASLSMLLRFPEHFKSQEMIDMICVRLVAASLSLLSQPPRDDGHYHIVIAEIFKFAFAREQLISYDLVIALSKMDQRVYLHLSPGSIPEPTRYFVQSTPIEVQIAIGICLESLNAPTQNVVGILTGDQDSKLVQYVLSLRRSTEERSQAFKLLLRKVHQTQRNNEKNQWKKWKLLGFLDAVQVFFSSIGSLTQSELNDWMDTLTTLCQSEGQALRESGAMKAFIIWAYQDWRGRPLMGDHMQDLHTMAKSISLSVDDINNTSWFTDLATSRSYRARS
ncbi:hypothetical protein B0H16DRAFT_1604483 [Mycena metata]|uniref:SH3 domain-containing protein n=1 Tax=Mycena metata TaxID=1033252 RepID=A0AAD7HGV0_9AGAR|nr:hypothetical protein B0H16DRAFT_1604483 [Mycena metata]